jgi:hypothetical protein
MLLILVILATWSSIKMPIVTKPRLLKLNLVAAVVILSVVTAAIARWRPVCDETETTKLRRLWLIGPLLGSLFIALLCIIQTYKTSTVFSSKIISILSILTTCVITLCILGLII